MNPPCQRKQQPRRSRGKGEREGASCHTACGRVKTRRVHTAAPLELGVSSRYNAAFRPLAGGARLTLRPLPAPVRCRAACACVRACRVAFGAAFSRTMSAAAPVAGKRPAEEEAEEVEDAGEEDGEERRNGAARRTARRTTKSKDGALALAKGPGLPLRTGSTMRARVAAAAAACRRAAGAGGRTAAAAAAARGGASRLSRPDAGRRAARGAQTKPRC